MPPIVLDSGLGGGQGQLAALERALAAQTIVCAYDRAGVGASDAPATTPRSTTELVADLDRFILAAELQPPVVLVGQSAGANVVFMYAQAHPAAVAGFVSMNPVPPAKPFLAAAKKVETADEFADEQTFYDGENEEAVSFRDTQTMLEAPLPATLPYAVMFDEDCGGDTEFCGRILPALTAATRSLADHGQGGRFIRAEGAGHEIFAADEALVLGDDPGPAGPLTRGRLLTHRENAETARDACAAHAYGEARRDVDRVVDAEREAGAANGPRRPPAASLVRRRPPPTTPGRRTSRCAPTGTRESSVRPRPRRDRRCSSEGAADRRPVARSPRAPRRSPRQARPRARSTLARPGGDAPRPTYAPPNSAATVAGCEIASAA